MNWLHGFQFLTCAAVFLTILSGMANSDDGVGWSIILFLIAGTGWAVLA